MYEFTDRMTALIQHIADTVPELAHVDTRRLLVSITRQRSRYRDGLFAHVTPMRFENGAHTTVWRSKTYQASRLVRNGKEILYVISFCLPRFLKRTFDEKIHTTIHELYHISPLCDGDVRRYGSGRIHTKQFHTTVDRLTDRFLALHDREHSAFLAPCWRTIQRRYGNIVGETLRIPQPRLIEPTPAEEECTSGSPRAL